MVRDTNLKVRLSEEEAEEVRQAAKARFMSMAAFIRLSTMDAARKVNGGEIE